MRVCELINTLDIGGAEKMLVDLSRALASRGHSIFVVCLRRTGRLAELLETAGIEVVEVDKGEGFSLRALRSLTGHLRERQVEVIHTHNPLVHHYGVMSARLAGVPVVVSTIHGPGNIGPFGLSRMLFDISCLFSSKIVPCCDAVAEQLRARTMVAGRRLRIIANGIETEAFGKANRKDSGSAFLFGTVGRLVAVKDHATLLDAFSAVRKARPECRLAVMGDGPLLEGLTRRAYDLGIGGAVEFVGPGHEVGKFLSALDAFVLSSVSEGLPLSVLEAMAAGVPIVSTPVGAVPKLVGDSGCGWLSPTWNPADLAGAMLHAVEATDLAARGANGKHHVSQYYSVGEMAGQYESLFLQLLSAC